MKWLSVSILSFVVALGFTTSSCSDHDDKISRTDVTRPEASKPQVTDKNSPTLPKPGYVGQPIFSDPNVKLEYSKGETLERIFHDIPGGFSSLIKGTSYDPKNHFRLTYYRPSAKDPNLFTAYPFVRTTFENSKAMLLPQEWAGYSFSVGELGFFETAYLDPRGRQYPDRSYFFLPLLPLPDELRRARIYAFPQVEKSPERIPEKITVLCFGDEVKYSGDDFYTEQNTIFRETMIAYGTFPKLPAKLYSLAVRDTLPDQTVRSFLLRPEYIMDNPPPALVAVTDVEIQGLHDSPQTFCGLSEESSLPPQIAVQALCKPDSSGKCTAP